MHIHLCLCLSLSLHSRFHPRRPEPLRHHRPVHISVYKWTCVHPTKYLYTYVPYVLQCVAVCCSALQWCVYEMAPRPSKCVTTSCLSFYVGMTYESSHVRIRDTDMWMRHTMLTYECAMSRTNRSCNTRVILKSCLTFYMRLTYYVLSRSSVSYHVYTSHVTDTRVMRPTHILDMVPHFLYSRDVWVMSHMDESCQICRSHGLHLYCWRRASLSRPDAGSGFWNTSTICSETWCVAVCCSVLQCVAVWCSVLQCVAVCDGAFVNTSSVCLET